jgi:hypothetical protein
MRLMCSILVPRTRDSASLAHPCSTRPNHPTAPYLLSDFLENENWPGIEIWHTESADGIGKGAWPLVPARYHGWM